MNYLIVIRHILGNSLNNFNSSRLFSPSSAQKYILIHVFHSVFRRTSVLSRFFFIVSIETSSEFLPIEKQKKLHDEDFPAELCTYAKGYDE